MHPCANQCGATQLTTQRADCPIGTRHAHAGHRSHRFAAHYRSRHLRRWDRAGGDRRYRYAAIGGKTFDVSKLTLSFATGEDGYFRIEGDDAKHPEQDCLPGLGGGIALYGDLPADVTVVQQLVGRDLPFEFTGDGDDFNLCFVGLGGLFGVEQGTVHISAVNGASVAFTFSGRFVVYDGQGGEAPLPVQATGRGVARVVRR